MTVFLSGGQLATVSRAMLFFNDTPGDVKLRPLFRESGNDISVGLSHSEGGEHFIVRQAIPEFASNALVDGTCARLLSLLGESYAAVTGRAAPWGK